MNMKRSERRQWNTRMETERPTRGMQMFLEMR